MRIHSLALAFAAFASLAAYGLKVDAVPPAAAPPATGNASGTTARSVATQKQQMSAARQTAKGQGPVRNQRIAQLLQQPGLQGSLQNEFNTALNSVLAGRPLAQAAQTATSSLESAARQELDNPAGTLNTAVQNALTNAFQSVKKGTTVKQAAQDATSALVSSAQQALNQATGTGVYVPWTGILDPGSAGLSPGIQAPVVDDSSAAVSGAPQTAAGAALQGTADVTVAAGQYNQATAKGAVNSTQAQSNAMRNQVQGVQTFWDAKDLGRAEREKERGPHSSPAELASRARAAAPPALAASQVDPETGAVHWPGAMHENVYQPHRLAIDKLMAKWVKYGALNPAEKTEVRQHIAALHDLLKSRIASIPPKDYTESRSLLESLVYATTGTMI